MRLNFFYPLIAITTISSISLPVSANPYEHKSWVDPNVLATDHRAYCSDNVGQNTQNDIEAYQRNDIGSDSNSNSNSQVNYHNQIKQGGGQASVLELEEEVIDTDKLKDTTLTNLLIAQTLLGIGVVIAFPTIALLLV